MLYNFVKKLQSRVITFFVYKKFIINSIINFQRYAWIKIENYKHIQNNLMRLNHILC